MPLSPGFPTDLAEYILVWCADLLEPLSAEERRQLVSITAMMHVGGPWPSRISIQRSAEQIRGLVDADANVGEMDLRLSGLDAIIGRLRAPDLEHEWVVMQLSRLPGSSELVEAVNDAVGEGILTSLDRDVILGAALSRAVMPEPIPAPAEFPALPPDHPESHEEFRRRDPPYEVGPTMDDDIESAIARLVDMHFAEGRIDKVQQRTLQTELIALGMARIREREQIAHELSIDAISFSESRERLKGILDRHPLPEAVKQLLG